MRVLALAHHLAELSRRARLQAWARRWALRMAKLACILAPLALVLAARTTTCRYPKSLTAKGETEMLVHVAEQAVLHGRVRLEAIEGALPLLTVRNKHDPWGVRYSLHVRDGEIVACSAGEDRRRGTPDDMCSNDRRAQLIPRDAER